MQPIQIGLVAAIIGTSFILLLRKDEGGILVLLTAIVAILLFFSVIWRVMAKKQMAMAEEIKDRTLTWWWMVAIFMLALATHRLVSFALLAFLCFAALREYFSLIPMRNENQGLELNFNDRLPAFFCYASILLVFYVAYIEWYGMFVILAPVYLFLCIPILLVLQNRARGSMQSMGFISLGFMFFVYNFGHCLFMINMGPMVLLYCFTLTEVRDLLSFWIGKTLARWAETLPEGRGKRLVERRIAPDISPKKTWSAGLAAALAIALLAMLMQPLLPEFPQGRMSLLYAAFTGFAIGILGLFGDLVFSMMKRDAGVKDSGTLLPGHGGIIDRVDSLVFTIPVTFHLIRWAYF